MTQSNLLKLIYEDSGSQFLTGISIKFTGQHPNMLPCENVYEFLFKDNTDIAQDSIILKYNEVIDLTVLKIRRWYTPFDIKHNIERVSVVNNEENFFSTYNNFTHLEMELRLEQFSRYEIWKSNKVIPNSLQIKHDNILQENSQDGKLVECTYVIHQDLECLVCGIEEEYDRFSNLIEDL